MKMRSRLHQARNLLPHDPRRRQALALGALVALVLGAFVTGGYLYRQSTGPANTHDTKAVPKERGLGTTGATSADPPAEDSSARRDRALPADPPNADSGSPPTEAAAAPASRQNDVRGAWTVNTRVDESSVAAFRGLRLGYRLDLRQDGDRITGTGRKVAENGSPLHPNAQTPIRVTGTIAGNQLRLTYAERGARRESTGTFVLRRESDNALRGSFSSNAARSSGAAEAHRR